MSRVRMRSQPKGYATSFSQWPEPGDVAIYDGWPCRMDQSRGRNEAARGTVIPVRIPGPKGVIGWEEDGDWYWIVTPEETP